jgi:sulfur carrier protein
MITVYIQPEGTVHTFPRLTSVLQLLNKLGRKPTRTLVIRGTELLTPDRRVEPGDTIFVRDVGSRG